MTDQPIHGALVEILLPFYIQPEPLEGPTMVLQRGTGHIQHQPEATLMPLPGKIPFLPHAIGSVLAQRLRPIPGTDPVVYSLELESAYSLDTQKHIGEGDLPVLGPSYLPGSAHHTVCWLPDSIRPGSEAAYSVLRYRMDWAADMKACYPQFEPLA